MEGKENSGHIKTKQNINAKIHDQSHAYSVGFFGFGKTQCQNKTSHHFFWTSDLKSPVLGCPSLLSLLGRATAGGDVKALPVLFFFLLSSFSPVTCSSPALVCVCRAAGPLMGWVQAPGAVKVSMWTWWRGKGRRKAAEQRSLPWPEHMPFLSREGCYTDLRWDGLPNRKLKDSLLF